MTHISNDKWTELKARMMMLGILEDDIEERFVLGRGSGGQKINKTHSVVQLKYKERVVRSKKSRYRDSNRFFARRELCNQVSADLGISTKDDMKIKKAMKQKKRRKSKSIKKYSDN